MMLQDVQLISRIAVSIVMEAAPFLFLGAMLSAAVDRYVDAERIARRIPSGTFGRMAAGLVGGLAMPVCECGSVPLARRLLEKGVPPLTAITYMLAAPVINPIVLLSTYIAFGGNLRMVLARVIVVAVSAALAGWLCGRGAYGTRHANPGLMTAPPHGGHAHIHAPHPVSAEGRAKSQVPDLLSSGAAEFLDMGKYLILGALAAAAFKVFLPWQLVQALAGSAFLSIFVLMLMAVLLCVCSEADAFVAAAFVYVPPAAQLGFIGLGAMVDLKLMGMYFAVFPKRTAWVLVIVPTVCVFGLSWLLGFTIEAG